MTKFISTLLFGFIIGFSATANTNFINDTLIIESETLFSFQKNKKYTVEEEPKQEVKFKRGKAIVLTVLTGFLGGHRIYLGTHQRTPIIYAVTLGGFGILPLIDLIHLIFTKDISVYENKSQIIMWRKE